MKVDLYIDGALADLSESSFLLLNYTFDEAGNPTIVKNSYSQTLTLPGTAANDVIFSHCFRPDHVTQSSGFSPMKRTPFSLYNERGEVLESGYIKLESIATADNGYHTYGITLYGGLGSLFYALTYNSDGSKRTLADMQYYDEEREEWKAASSYAVPLTAANVKNAWDVLAGDHGTPFEFFNFVPCYNGIPDSDFDAAKYFYRKPAAASNQFAHGNLYTSGTKDGDTYTGKGSGNNDILVEMADSHTEWEMQDLRCYLQRPAISIKGLLSTLCHQANTGEYTLVLSSGLTSDNCYYDYGWITLKLFDRTKHALATATLADYLESTSTPADYLVGLAKVMGLCFVTDSATKTVTMMTRNEFFSGSTIDISDKVCRESTDLPNALEGRYYVYDVETDGAFAADYLSTFGKTYGSKWVDTGCMHGENQIDLLDGLAFRGCADARESSGFFQVFGGASDAQGAYTNSLFKAPMLETCTFKLYRTNAENEEESADFTPTDEGRAPLHYSLGTSYNDFHSMPQFHDADGKPTDGDNVLVFFNGMQDLPASVVGGVSIQTVDFHTSDDDSQMLSMNGDKPCWCSFGTAVSQLPMFRRWYMPEGDVKNLWEFGKPQLTVVPESISGASTVYDCFWSAYIADRYDADAVVTTRKVDLSQMVVNADLLRNFYWFDGCVWVLNKIANYAPTEHALTDCEFVKVKDIDNYQTGQTGYSCDL